MKEERGEKEMEVIAGRIREEKDGRRELDKAGGSTGRG